MSNDIVISVRNLGKQYQIGHNLPYLTIGDIFFNIFKKPKSFNENQILIKGEKTEQSISNSERFWALREVTFDINRGEVVGIIGRNGAGKSTLLKVISRVTSPTVGQINIKGRVGSLLEIGTGFHPELTGRENIFLSGLILGMKRKEINEKFDAIVKFSGVEKYLDTPVKRYSSGMNVRLGFSVAAHLEPEILLIDEVLAVGDAEFQKRCLGKMKEVSEEGRTILFVSHSMPMIASLCDKCILLNKGKIQAHGETSQVIASYLLNNQENPAFIDYSSSSHPPGDEFAILLSGWIENCAKEKKFDIRINEPFRIMMKYRILKNVPKIPYPNFHIFDNQGQCICVVSPVMDYNQPCKAGDYLASCDIPPNFLNDGLFSVHLALTFTHMGLHVSFCDNHALSFNIVDPIEGVPTRSIDFRGRIPGVIRPIFNWTVERIS